MDHKSTAWTPPPPGQENIDTQQISSPDAQQKKDLRLPVIALCLVLSPVLQLWITSLLSPGLSTVLLASVILPTAGVIAGIASLCQGKKRIGTAGMIMSIVAVALPAIAVGIVFLFIMLVNTGALVFGM